jgi:hypothetical protein
MTFLRLGDAIAETNSEALRLANRDPLENIHDLPLNPHNALLTKIGE